MINGPLAYMDPGTGSLFLQLLLGGVAGALVFIKLFWHRILSVLGLRRPAESEQAPDELDLQNPELKGSPKP